jgi:malate dehydrogenase (oxaloacetate-decarboxylating)
VTDNMLAAAAQAVSELVDTATPGAPLLPKVEALRETSVAVAAAVARAAAADRVATDGTATEGTVAGGTAAAGPGDDLRARIRALMWEPVYRRVRPA